MTESARLIVTVDSTQVARAATDLSALERSALGAEQANNKLVSSAASAATASKGLGSSAVEAASGAQRIESAAVSAALGLNEMTAAAGKAGSASAGLERIGRNAEEARSAVERLSSSSQSLGGDMAKAGSSISTVARAIDGLDVIQDVDDHISNFNDSVKDSKDNADEAADAFSRFRDSANDVQDVTPPTGSAVDNLSEALKRLILQVAAFVSVVEGIKKLSDVQRQFDVLNAGLVTATTSAEKAAGAFGALQQFAAKTPYDLNQAVDGFTKLVNLGLTPSEKAMISYGNTASAMGKDLNQMIEAVADATTGEFERLKEFGIKAKADGDKVTMVFQGMKTTIGNNAKEIEKYLIALGENQFAGAMARRVDTLDGKIAALGDTWDTTFRLINNAGAGAIMKDSVQAANDALEELNSQLASGQLETNLAATAGKFKGWAADVKTSFGIVSEALTQESGFWSQLVSNNVDNMVSTFRDFPENVRALIQLMTVEIAAGLDKAYVYAVGFARKAKAALSFGNNEAEYEAVGKQLEADLSAVNQARESSIVSIIEERNAAVESFAAQRNMATMQREMYESGQALAARSTEDRLASFKKVSEAEKELTDEQKKAAKDAASVAERQKKALDDLIAQSAIAVKSTNAMADAYLGGAANVRALTIEQKIEEELLKTGSAARGTVAKAINAEADARDRLAIGEMIAQMRVENVQILDLAKATLRGEAAVEDYNVAKQVQVALAGKNIVVGSKEHQLLLDQTKAQLANNKALEQANRANDVVDRLNPQIKALRDYRDEQEALTRAMEMHPEKADLYRAALVKLGNEYEVNRAQATIWGQMTEAAVDRIDGVFADAWANIGDGAESLWDNLKKGFKQTLGEIMHMLTTKPLLASISNWLTGTDNGQGLGSVWSKILGSAETAGSGSSGGGLWSGAVGLGKNLYSAWSAITGVGSAASAGFASGGITGAVGGIGSYYGGMLSSAVSTLSGGFSSLGAALGLNTAATTAATAAGTGYGLGGTLVSGSIGSASYATGTSALSSALSSAGAMWPLAIIMGMYQSGKLYDAGVRPDASEMWASGGDTALGKAAMTPQTLGAGWLKIKDDILGSVVGGKLAAIITGSTVFQAVWSKVGSKLFGTSYQTKDTGIQLSVADGVFDPLSYADQKKKGGLISGSSKKRTLYGELDDETASALGQAYNTTVLGAIDLFSTLNVALNEHVLDGLNVAASKISTQGRTQEEIQTEIDAWFTALGDSAVTAINSATSAGLDGFTLESLTSFVNNLVTVNASIGNLGVKMLEMSVASGFAVENLVNMAGSLEQLSTNMNSFYSGFTTDIQKSTDLLAGVRAQFVAMGVALPATRDAYKDLLQAQDVSTEAGRTMFTILTAGAENAAAAYSILEQRQADYFGAFYTEAENTQRGIDETSAALKELGVVLPATRDGFRAMVEGLDLTTESGRKMYDTLMSVAGSAGTVFDALEATAHAAADAATEAAQAIAAANANYFSLFATETQKSAATLDAFTDQLTAVGLAMPANRDGFIAMVDAIDTTTAAGQSLFNSLMGMATDADAAFQVLEAQSAAVSTALMNAASAGFSAVQRAITAEQKAATEAYNARTASFSDMLSTVTANISDLSSVSSSLEDALKSLTGSSDETVKQLRAQAQATLQSALAKARSGGSLAGFEGLEDALSTVSTNDTGLYASLEDFNREQGRTANVVAELNTLNGKQLSSAEKSVEALNKQIEAAKKAYDLQMSQFDTQLASAQAQLDALNGIDNSVMSVAAAMQAMNSAIVAALVAKETGSAAQNNYDNNVTLLESVYRSVLGRGLDVAGKATWTAALANGSLSYADLASTIANAGRANGEKVVPGFAAGGTFGGGLRLVGENGPELEVTGPSRIYNANQTAAMLANSGDGQATAQEVRALRAELKAALFAIAKNTMKTAKNTDLIPRKLEEELFS